MRLVALTALLVLAGCPDKNSPPRYTERVKELLKRSTEQMCACKDQACADKVQEELTAWSMKMGPEETREQRDYRRDHPEQWKEVSMIGERYGECLMRAMSPDGAGSLAQ